MHKFFNEQMVQKLEHFGVVLGTATSIVGVFYALYSYLKKKIEKERKLLELFTTINDLKQDISEIRNEYRSNGGSSTSDKIDKITASIKRIEASFLFQEKMNNYIMISWGIGHWESDDKGSYIKVSPSYCHIAGRTEEELLDYNWINHICEDDRERIYSSWKKAVEDKRDFSEIYCFVKADGNIQKVKGLAYHIYDVNRNLIGFFGTLTPL